ncbi:MAG: hypothetical protein ACMUIU_06940 [bacterium]
MITTNILQRVFRIYHNGKTASSYTIEKGERQFLVSAAHVFKGSIEINEIEIYHDDTWKKLPVEVAYNSHTAGDTIVFKLPHDISPRYPITSYGPGGVLMGSWAYFLGFPLGLMTPSGDINNKFPFPLVKAALISSIDGSLHGISTILLDGHNNKGFSGAPLAWYPPNQTKKVHIIGTISGYLQENPKASVTQEDVDLFEVNAGIIKAYWIKDLFDYID